MNRNTNSILFVCCLSALACLIPASGETEAKIELIEPFSTWFLTESLDFYIRVTNTGEEPLRLAYINMGGVGDTDLFFEIDPDSRRRDGSRLILPRVQTAEKRPNWGLNLPSDRAFVLSDADFNEAEFVNSECFTRVKVHFLLEKGRWVSSDWVERKILPAPDLSGESLYEFILDPVFGKIPNKVLPLKMGDETWLFSHHTGNPDRVGQRLCRVPDGVSVSSIEFDLDARRLAIRFEGGEEPVVVNTRTGLPLSGSERTVPHLHLWKKLAGRPFTDVYQQLLERQQGKRDELDRSRSTVPAISPNDAHPPHPHDQKKTGEITESFERSGSASDSIKSQDAKTNAVSMRTWLVALGVMIALIVGIWLETRVRR